MVRFIYTRGKPGVYAWDLTAPPNPKTLDVPRYAELLQRAAETVMRAHFPTSPDSPPHIVPSASIVSR